MTKQQYTLITGASRGLGKELALACAKRRMNLVLIAYPGEGLFRKGVYLITRFNIKVATYELDLTNTNELSKLIEKVNQRYEINMLINNAGVGGSCSFQDVSSTYLDNIMLLNMRALVLLTHGLMVNLSRQKKAHILNVASMASFGPMPFKTVYPASKAFVYSFSRGLNTELKGTGVRVSVAHPGGMATTPEIKKRIDQHGVLVRSTIVSPERTAEICISRLLKNDALIIPGIMNKVSWLFFKLCPVWFQLIIFRNSITKEFNQTKQIAYAG